MLRVLNVSKAYPGVRALDDVSVEFRDGEVHGVVGENGAGKSTLTAIVGGAVAPDRGALELAGSVVTLAGPADARARGIGIVHQHLQSALSLSVTENVLLGSPSLSRGLVNWREAHRQAEAVFAELGVDIDVRAPMRALNPARRKLVEIARAICGAATVIFFDEPTAALDAEDADHLFNAMRRLRERGLAVAFTSHRLEEVLAVTDRVSVLRDGRLVGTWPTEELTVDRLIVHMVGRELSGFFSDHPEPRSEVVLDVRGATITGRVHGVDLQVRAGQIVGLAGLLGSGRTDLAEGLFGAVRLNAGRIFLAGREVRFRSPVDAVRAGVAYVPSNRQEEGLVPTMNLTENLTLAVLRELRTKLLVDRTREAEMSSSFVKRLRVVASSTVQPIETLSGGNQQKVLLARWLATRPRVLILDEPTQGVDVGAKAEIHQLISGLATAGLAIVLISSDLPELLAMADHVLVMHTGRVVASLSRAEATQERVIEAATGQTVVTGRAP
jgi:ABC-type sugar transport system ATPase subunit